MAMEPKRSFGPTSYIPPYFTPLSEPDQFAVGYDPEYDYVDLGHNEQSWARRLYRQRIIPARFPPVEGERNRPVPLPQSQMPRNEEDWWGYSIPKDPGIYVTAARAPVEAPLGVVGRIQRGLNILLGRA